VIIGFLFRCIFMYSNIECKHTLLIQDDAAGLYSIEAYEVGSETSIWRRADTHDEAEVFLAFFFGLTEVDDKIA